ncbi:nitric oxide reductase transcription regulator, partial [Klebsiella quasipneumoniae]|nr:nitric oxide reductase transcription regulator [Klebsiella quasipneumoniae]
NVNLREATDHFQREAMSRTLAAHQGNWAASARALELDVAILHRLANRLGLNGSRPGNRSAG